MENHSGLRYRKFFRGLIASHRPEEIIKIVERYQRDLRNTESNYMDLIIKSQGLLSYQEIMEMPIDSILLFVERLNQSIEEKNHQVSAAKSKRR